MCTDMQREVRSDANRWFFSRSYFVRDNVANCTMPVQYEVAVFWQRDKFDICILITYLLLIYVLIRMS